MSADIKLGVLVAVLLFGIQAYLMYRGKVTGNPRAGLTTPNLVRALLIFGAAAIPLYVLIALTHQ